MGSLLYGDVSVMGRIRALVAMAASILHRLIKIGN